MSLSAKTIAAAGVYLFGTGAWLLLAPGLFFSIFHLASHDDTWIRVVGVLALVLAFYYMQAARFDARQVFGWTVSAKSVVFLAFLFLVFARRAPHLLLLFGLVDLIGAIATGLALRRDGEKQPDVAAPSPQAEILGAAHPNSPPAGL